MNINEIKPSPDLYLQVRIGFVGQNSSLNKWCTDNGITRQNAVAALKGMFNGPKGIALRERVVIAAGLIDCEEDVDVAS